VKISIALCTYNGAEYLQEQLASIMEQTQPANEIMLCDDGSTDDTINIAQQFLSQGLPIHIHENPERLGSTANFNKAISQCTGELIFLCDQDDIWSKNKVASTIEYFQQNPATELALSNGALINQHGNSMGKNLWETLTIDSQAQLAFLDLLNNDKVTGAACAFRSSLKKQALPIPTEWIHDSWLAIIAAAHGKIGMIPEVLFSYRQHPSNQIGLDKTDLKAKLNKLHTLATTRHTTTPTRYLSLQNRLPKNHPTQVEIKEKVEHLQNRQPISGRRINIMKGILKELSNGRYFKYSNGFQSIIRDISLLIFQKNQNNSSSSVRE